MSDENGFDINQIKRCVTTLLPNEVIFALGNSEEVKCASVWIKHLQDRLSEAEKLTKQFVDHINDINNGDDPSECEKYLFNLVSEYQKKWSEKV